MPSIDFDSDTTKLTERESKQDDDVVQEKLSGSARNSKASNLEEVTDTHVELPVKSSEAEASEGQNVGAEEDISVSEDLELLDENYSDLHLPDPTSELDFFGDKIDEAGDIADNVASRAGSVEDTAKLKPGGSAEAPPQRERSVWISDDFVSPPVVPDEVKHSFTLTSIVEVELPTWPEMITPEEIMEDPSEVKGRDSLDIDRNMYYQLHAVFEQRNRREKMKNNFLHSRLSSYYIKRKMLYVLKEQTFHLAEMQSKYEKDLDALEQLAETCEREKRTIQHELQLLTTKRDSKMAELSELFEKLQRDELEYGKGLTYDKTGKSNMDKIVERFIKRQKNQMALMMELRLNFIKLRNKMTEKVKALEALDHLGPGFRIMDYVQLKIDNRDLQDKLEEREGELTKLRRSCQNTIQILAHNREKTALLDLDIEKLREELESVVGDYSDAREQLYYLRQDRDEVRNSIKNLKVQFGLLTNKKALRDMENAVTEVDALKAKLEVIQEEYHLKSKQIAAVRKNIEYYLHLKNKEEMKKKGYSSDSSLSLDIDKNVRQSSETDQDH